MGARGRDPFHSTSDGCQGGHADPGHTRMVTVTYAECPVHGVRTGTPDVVSIEIASGGIGCRDCLAGGEERRLLIRYE